MLLTHMPLLLTISTCIREIMFCRSHIRIQVENIPKGANRRCKAEMREGNKKRSPPTRFTQAEYHRGQGLGPSRNRPGEGDREIGPPGVGAPWVRPHPHHLHSAPLFYSDATMLRRFPMVTKNTCTKPTKNQYKQEGSAHLTTHTSFGATSPYPTLVLFQLQFLVVIGASKATWRACLLGRRATLV